MPSNNESEYNIMSVRDLIDSAFGEFEGNVVNFKLVQTILYLLARHMRLLERQIEIEYGPQILEPTGSTLSVTEVKIHAVQKKGRRTKDEGAKSAGSTKSGVARGGKGRKSQSGRGAAAPSSSEKTSSEKTSTDKTSSEKTVSDKTSDKTSTDQTSTDKTSTDKTSSEKTSTDKTSSDITSTDKTSSDKTSTDKTSTDKTSSDKTSTDKTSSDKTSTDKTSSDKTSTDKTSTDKTSSSKTTSSSKDKSTTSKSSGEKSKSPKWGSKADRKATTEQMASQQATDETGSREPATKRAGSGKSSPKREPTDARSSKKKTDSYHRILEAEEERREKLLRVIHQRADSFETTTKSPTPMASVTSMGAQREKILVVERVPSSELRKGGKTKGRTPQISVVTQEEFEQLAQAVEELQNNLLPIGTPGFPENIELMQELRRGASLTDAMAALQLSARLEATEKALVHMISMITELAKQTPGVKIDEETKLIFEAPGIRSGTVRPTHGGKAHKTHGVHSGSTKSGGASRPVSPSGPSSAVAGGAVAGGISASAGAGGLTSVPHVTPVTSPYKSPDPSHKAQSHTSSRSQERVPTLTISERSSESSEIMAQVKPTDETASPDNVYAIKPEYVTYEDLDVATKQLYDNLIHILNGITSRTGTIADNAHKLATSLEGRIEAALVASSRMSNLENLVGQYAGQINALDTGLSSQMTNYQEQLTQMQHDLEIGLETMAEVLGNTGGDTAAVAELNSHFTSLQMDFDNMLYRQRELKDALDSISFDLETLWKQIEMLRDTKSDREEVTDALRDKAGIGELNGLVSLLQFDAVRGDFEKRIGAAYDKFNSQEMVWQKAIDDLLRELSDKADLIQVESLRDEINKYLNIMKARMQVIIDIVGEPKSAMLSKKLFRNTTCLSCGSPAHMDIEEPCLVPALPKLYPTRQPGAEAELRSKGDGDHGICYPGLPLPHPRDPRSHVCQRYCGGSHTLLNEIPCRVPSPLAINHALREINTELGTDGKMYLVDEEPKKIPCLPCNKPKSDPQSKPKKGSVEKPSSDTTPPPDLDIITGNEDITVGDEVTENDNTAVYNIIAINDFVQENDNVTTNDVPVTPPIIEDAAVE